MTVRRRDPRVDPLSLPPDEEGDPRKPRREAQAPILIEHLAVSTIIAERSHSEPPPGESLKPQVMSADPRLEMLDRRIANNDWTGIVSELGPLQDVGRLPPNLGLAAALAHHELASEGDQDAVAIGVRCTAALLGVPETSQTAGLIGRRLFRKNPVRLAERPAPPPRTSLVLVAAALVVGGTVGWLLSGGLAVVRALFGR